MLDAKSDEQRKDQMVSTGNTTPEYMYYTTWLLGAHVHWPTPHHITSGSVYAFGNTGDFAKTPARNNSAPRNEYAGLEDSCVSHYVRFLRQLLNRKNSLRRERPSALKLLQTIDCKSVQNLGRKHMSTYESVLRCVYVFSLLLNFT